MNWEFVVTIIVAVGFGIATLVLGIKRAKKKKPVCGYAVRKIIGLGSNAPLGVKLSFNDEEVKSVYRTILIFFNKGNEVIEKKDVVKGIAVDFGDGRILKEPVLLSISKEENNFSVNKVADNSVELGFDYLGHNDGACIEVMHTGGSQLSMNGTIIDTPISEIGGFAEHMEYPSVMRTIILGIGVVALWVFFGIQLHYVLSAGEEPVMPGATIALSVTGAIAMLLTVILRDDVPLVIRAMRFPYWGRNVSKRIAGKFGVLGGPVFAYCPKCRHEVEMKRVAPIKMRNGVVALSGTCVECGGTIYRVEAAQGGK